MLCVYGLKTKPGFPGTAEAVGYFDFGACTGSELFKLGSVH